MPKLLLFLVVCLFLVDHCNAQNKTEKPSTFRDVCFFTIDKDKFQAYQSLQNEVMNQKYSNVYSILKRMRKALKKFDLSDFDNSFEFWYTANYTDFEKQIEVARQSTLASLATYEKRIKEDKAKYFDHRSFLNSYLAFETEVFYQDFWFMSMERYFSEKMVARVKEMNEEGVKLFTYSEFYQPFESFDEMVRAEEDDMKKYLQIDQYGADSDGVGKKSLIPYSYAVFDQTAASYILQTFEFDAATQDLDVDREIRAFKRFLQRVRSDKIWLVVRFDTIPFGTVVKD